MKKNKKQNHNYNQTTEDINKQKKTGKPKKS